MEENKAPEVKEKEKDKKPDSVADAEKKQMAKSQDRSYQHPDTRNPKKK